MLSKEELAHIVTEYFGINGYIPISDMYILLDGRIYPTPCYDEAVTKGNYSANDIYAFVDPIKTDDLVLSRFNINFYLGLHHILRLYLRKRGFTIELNGFTFPPAQNLKYYIVAVIKFTFYDIKPEYLVVNVYDFDFITNSLGLPQLIEQTVGNKPVKITADDMNDIMILMLEQPLLAGHTLGEADNILRSYFIRHEDKYKDEALKIINAYNELFPVYQVCNEWDGNKFVETNCLKMMFRSSSS